MLACKLCGFTGDPTSMAEKPYSFVIFQGDPDPLPPSGFAHGDWFIKLSFVFKFFVLYIFVWPLKIGFTVTYRAMSYYLACDCDISGPGHVNK